MSVDAAMTDEGCEPRASARSPLAFVLRGLVNLYRGGISPYFAPTCRYHPTCSQYALDAVDEHGALRGAWLALKRIGRCHPWHEGGYDPVPRAARHACDASCAHGAPGAAVPVSTTGDVARATAATSDDHG